MALPSSGTISLSQIQSEFGGSNPISLSEYYGAASGVPSSGTISLSDFHGTSANLQVSINPTNLIALVQPGQTASDSATVSVSGGTAPYSYSWSIMSQDGNAYFSDSVGPTATLSDYFSVIGSNSGTIRCIVTDTNNVTGTAIATFFFSAEN